MVWAKLRALLGLTDMKDTLARIETGMARQDTLTTGIIRLDETLKAIVAPLTKPDIEKNMVADLVSKATRKEALRSAVMKAIDTLHEKNLPVVALGLEKELCPAVMSKATLYRILHQLVQDNRLIFVMAGQTKVYKPVADMTDAQRTFVFSK